MSISGFSLYDWIKVKHESVEEYISITSINSTLICDRYIIDEIEPIPLTKDILNLNSFEMLCDGLYPTLRNNNGEIIIQINAHFRSDKDGYYFKEPSFNVTYVHELQHLLRLVGKTEIADLFKVQ